MEEFRGKVAVVTAAASGMGLAMCRRFSRAGMKVVLADVDEVELITAVDALRKAGADAVGVVTDVSDTAAMERLREVTFERYGTIHVLCNHAGVGGGGPISAPPIDPDGWRRSLDVCLFGVINALNCFLPTLLDQDEGHIVNTSSRQGLVATPGLAAYGPSKFAVAAATEMLAAELSARGSAVGVSLLCPGGVRTKTLPAPGDVPATMDPERRALLAERYADAVEPEEVADLVLAAIRSNTLYVLTHQETIDWMETRLERIQADLSRLGPLR
jgi:NAD(P)-dependent dehydrogenase (short-subunit alcohol dehydrogenase family)